MLKCLGPLKALGSKSSHMKNAFLVWELDIRSSPRLIVLEFTKNSREDRQVENQSAIYGDRALFSVRAAKSASKASMMLERLNKFRCYSSRRINRRPHGVWKNESV